MKKDFIAAALSISLMISGFGINIPAAQGAGSDTGSRYKITEEASGKGDASADNPSDDIFGRGRLVCEEPDWLGIPAVLDDSLTADEIEEMTGSRIGEDDGAFGTGEVLRGTVEGYDELDEFVEPAWPADSARVDKIDEYLLTHTSPTRDQGRYSTCWAFSAIALAECYAINRQGASPDIDLSERHLSYMTCRQDQFHGV